MNTILKAIFYNTEYCIVEQEMFEDALESIVEL